jgi:hypothetical protein
VRLSAAGEGGSKHNTKQPQALFSSFRKKSPTFWKNNQYQLLTRTDFRQ